MTKNKHNITLTLAALTLPLFLASCDTLQNYFDDWSSSPKYNSNYSSDAQYKGQNRTVLNSDGESTNTNNAGAVSGTAATTVSAPVATETAAPTGTVDSPVVPSVIPTVDQ